jgi:hypothetical protein
MTTALDKAILNKFIKNLKYNSIRVDNKNIVWKYRYLCYKLNIFLQHIPLPIIKQKSYYEAVFIDFRILPNIEFVIRNAIFKLGPIWSFTIVCGKENNDYMRNIVKKIDQNIKIICLEYNNLSHQEYSNLLTTVNFWEMFYGEKILIYQEDSLLFHGNILPFLKYDFIGAPFLKNSDDTPNCVGNGGLSIRTKCKMLEVIKNHTLNGTRLNSSTLNYMNFKNLTSPPEDIYFSKNMQDFNIGDVANWDEAFKFSSEQVFNPTSVGGHQYWISNTNWQNFTIKLFNFSKYIPKSDINKYLEFQKLPQDFNKTPIIKNAFDIDLKFFCHVNNIKYINDYDTLSYILIIGLDGFLYHPKQLYNIFNKHINLYCFLDKLYTFYDDEICLVQDFVNKRLYNTSFDYLAQLLIKKKYDTINDNYDTLLLVFLGNPDIAVDLLTRIIKYKKINNEFNAAFCINKNIKNDEKIINFIKNNFDFYAIYYSNELGTDITPTLLMYNDISKNHTIKHVLKFHTKTISDVYDNLTNYLLENSLQTILQDKKNTCNCIGPHDSYITLKKDVFNNKLKIKHNNDINIDFEFVGGTIFYAENKVFEKVIEFLKNNNYRSYFLNNLYENNTINHDFSPIHFLERLFGSIKL